MGAFKTMMEACRRQVTAMFPPEDVNTTSINSFCSQLVDVAMENHITTGVLDLEEIAPLEPAWWVNGVFFTLVMSITVVINVLSMFILLSSSMRSPTNVLLAVITVLDLLTCVLQVPVNAYAYLDDGYKELPTYIWCDIYNYVHNFLPSAFHSAAFLLNVYLSVQRCVGVKAISRGKIISTYKGTVGAVVTCTIFSFLIHSMYPFSIGVEEVQAISKQIVSLEGLQYVSSCRMTPRHPNIYDKLFSAYLWLRVALLQTLPALVLCTCNIILIRASYHSYNYRRRLVGSVGTLISLGPFSALNDGYQARPSAASLNDMLSREFSLDSNNGSLGQASRAGSLGQINNTTEQWTRTPGIHNNLTNSNSIPIFFISPDDRVVETTETEREDPMSVAELTEMTSRDAMPQNSNGDYQSTRNNPGKAESGMVTELVTDSPVDDQQKLAVLNTLLSPSSSFATSSISEISQEDLHQRDMVCIFDLRRSFPHLMHEHDVQEWSNTELGELSDKVIAHAISVKESQRGDSNNSFSVINDKINDHITWWDFLREHVVSDDDDNGNDGDKVDTLQSSPKPEKTRQINNNSKSQNGLCVLPALLRVSESNRSIEKLKYIVQEKTDSVSVDSQSRVVVSDEHAIPEEQEETRVSDGLKCVCCVSNQSHELPVMAENSETPLSGSSNPTDGVDIHTVTSCKSIASVHSTHSSLLTAPGYDKQKDNSQRRKSSAMHNGYTVKESTTRRNSKQRRKSSQPSNFISLRSRSITSQFSRKSSIHQSHAEFRSSIMLILVTSCTLIAEVFVIILLIFKFVNTVRDRTNQLLSHTDLATLIMISNIITTITFPLNFVFFCGLSKAFRDTLSQRFHSLVGLFHRLFHLEDKTATDNEVQV